MADPTDPTAEPAGLPEPTAAPASTDAAEPEPEPEPEPAPDFHTDDDGVTWHRREDPAEDLGDGGVALAASDSIAAAEDPTDFDALCNLIAVAAQAPEGRTVIRAALQFATDDDLSAECGARAQDSGDPEAVDPVARAKALARELQAAPDLAVAVVSQLRIAQPWEGPEGRGRRLGLDGRGDVAVTEGIEYRGGRLIRVGWRLLVAPPGERPAWGDAGSEETARADADTALAKVPGYAIASVRS